MIQDYFMEINEGVFLNECKYKNQKEVNARHKVVQLAVDFMMNMYVWRRCYNFPKRNGSECLDKIVPICWISG